MLEFIVVIIVTDGIKFLGYFSVQKKQLVKMTSRQKENAINAINKLLPNFEDETKKSILRSSQILAVLTILTGLLALLFEVELYTKTAMYVYAFRFFAVSVSFWVLIISNFSIGKNHPYALTHAIFLSIIISYAAVLIYHPQNLLIHSQLTALIIFTASVFLKWDVKHQMIVVIYYNLVFGSTLIFHKGGLILFQNVFASVMIVIFISIISIVAVAANNKLRNKLFEKTKLLDATERKYHEIFESSNIGIFQMDFEGNILLSNKAFNNIFYGDKDQSNKVNGKYFSGYFLTDIKEHLLEKNIINDYQIRITKDFDDEKICLLNCRVVEDQIKKMELIEGTIQDVTIKYHYEEALKIAKQKAEQSNKMKNDFLSQMSHEIRTPINSIKQAIEFLKEIDDFRNDSELKFMLDILDASSKRIIRTVHLVLNLAEVSNGSYEYTASDFDLVNDCLVQLYDEYNTDAEEKGIKLKLNKKTMDTGIKADMHSLKYIFNNILDNSIKFTEAGSVEINIGKNNSGKLFVEISDTGIGISDDYLPNLFKAFSQEENGYTRKYDGNGLGLALVKKYCDLNNASISVQSKKHFGTKVIVAFNS